MMDIRDNSLDSFMASLLGESVNPDVIYHYTTLDTFSKLISNDADLYCTHYKALNDDSEFRLGLQYAMGYLRRHGVTMSGKNLLSDVFFRIRHRCFVPWITSFSSRGDSLPQWIAYTHSERGGCAVGFDCNVLKDAVRRLMSRQIDLASRRVKNLRKMVYLLPCVYMDIPNRLSSVRQDFADETADALLDFMLRDYQDNLDVIFAPGVNEKRERMVAAILLFASVVKQYAQEKGVRWEASGRNCLSQSPAISADTLFKGADLAPSLPLDEITFAYPELQLPNERSKRMAEFHLVEKLPLGLIDYIAVRSEDVEAKVKAIVGESVKKIEVRPEWYFDFT